MNHQPIYSLVLPETDRLLCEAETLEALLLAAATIREEGEPIDAAVVLRGGEFDGAATQLVQMDGMVI